MDKSEEERTSIPARENVKDDSYIRGNRIREQMPDEESADSAKNLTLIDFLAEVARPPRPKIPTYWPG